MNNSKDTIGIRTRDLPVCGAVPQPTASLRAPIYKSAACNVAFRKAIKLPETMCIWAIVLYISVNFFFHSTK